MKNDYEKELKLVRELFDFLQGRLPAGTIVALKDRPKLNADQAWTVIWYLGNQYWQVPDYIERCCVCGDLYHAHTEGDCLDFGRAPYHFCDSCMEGEAFKKKAMSRANPDKQQRKNYLEK